MENGKQPAFPLSNSGQNESTQGITKREYFASTILQGYMAYKYAPHQNPVEVAKYAILCADELLKQLEQ